MREPGQGLYLNLRPAQFPEGFLGCIQFQMAIGGAQGAGSGRAVKGCCQQQDYDANADINTFHAAPPCRNPAV